MVVSEPLGRDQGVPSVLARIQALVQKGEVRISAHGYDELAKDGLTAREVVAGVSEALVVEEYPQFAKGPCVLVFQRDGQGSPIHVVWGIPAGASSPAVVVTAYRPDPDLWSEDFLERRK